METCKCPCAFDNNGRFLALLSSDGRLKVWDCRNGILKHEYTPSSHLSATCTCLKWLNSSRGSETPRRKKQKTSHKSSSSATSSPSVIALGTSSGDILIYNLAEGEIQERLRGSHDDKVTDLAWNLNGDLYSCSSDKHIVEWNTGKSKQKSKWKADRHGVNSICVSPLGNCLLSAGRSIKLWDLETKQMLKKFTGHASPVSELLFLSSPKSDSNGNHVPEKSINGLYFLSGAQDERLLNVWYVDLESRDNNALVSLSITDHPMAIDVSHYDSADKPVHVAVTSKDGQLHIFEKSLNGGGKKPVTPTRSIQVATPAEKNKPSPIPFLCAKLLTAEEPSVLVAYGSLAKPQFETLAYASFEKHTCLTREDNSSLPIKHGSQSSGPVDKANRNMMDATTLGPTSMALARPSMAQNGDDGEQSSTTRKQNIPEQSLEDRLKAMNQVSKGRKESRKSIPTTSSMVQMLTQALHSQDRHLLEDVLQSGVKGGIIKNTVHKLPVQFIVPFIKEIIFKIQVSPNRGGRLAVWLKYILSIHMTYLMTVPNLVESLSNLYTMMETRVGVFGRLCKLQGRLDLVLSQVSTQNQADNEERMLNEPLAVYNEEDSEEEEVHFDDSLALEGEHSDSEEKWDEDMDDDDEDDSIESEDDDDNAKDDDDDDENEDDDDDNED